MSVTGFIVDGQIQKYDYGSLDNLPDIPENSGTFWATYNSTSETEITDAFSNNKSVMMKIGNDVFYVMRKLSIGPSGSAWLFVSVGNTNIRTTWVSGSYWNSFSTNTIGGEISNDLKQALLQLASKVAYIDEDGQTYYNDLYNALYPHELMSISATFNQGSNIIYDIDPLTVLNQYLTVVANYSDGTTETISSSNYTLSGNLLEGVSTITVYYEGFTDTFDVNVTHMAGYYTIVNNLTGCTTNNSATAIQENTSYTATITASAGYTLSGATVTITMGGNILTGVFSNGTISIPNVTGDLVITVVASAVTLSSITAAYTQSGTVYDTDTLDSLKADLVVTAHYSDSSTQTVPAANYTLSGTLAAGTSTITVGYSGKTTTFNVTVTRFEIKVFRGKGVSDTTIADNAKRALSEPVAFTNVAPITIEWPSYSSIKMGFKNTTTNQDTIDTTTVVIVPIEYLGKVYSSADGWLTVTSECGIAYRSSTSQPCNAYTYPTTSGYARLLFANASDTSSPLPTDPIDGVVYINSIPHHLVEADISDFE